MVTAVALPVIAVIALARVGGSISLLTGPIGRTAGLLLATVCYLALGPLFATPRTANVSFALGIAPFTGDGALPQFIYSLLFFTPAMIVSLYPGRLLDNVGHILAPLKIPRWPRSASPLWFGPPVNRSPPSAAIRHRRFPPASCRVIKPWTRCRR